MNNIKHTETRIYKLIPDDSPSCMQLRLYFNDLLRLNKKDTSSPVYHPPLDWPESTITGEELSELHQLLVSGQKLVTFPVSAYLASLGLPSDNIRSMAWAAMNVHVLLSLAGMREREELIRVLCVRFRLPLSHPNDYGWLWMTLPLIQSDWEQLTEQLSTQEKSPLLSDFSIDENIPQSANARIGEIRHAYETALLKKAKIARINIASTQKTRFPFRTPLTPKIDSTLHKVNFPPKKPVPQVNQIEQRFDEPQPDRLIDSSKPIDPTIQNSAATQVFTNRFTSAHITRRSFELYSEPSILLPEQVQALFCSIHNSLTSSCNSSENFKADAILLLSLLTNTATNDLLDFNELFKSKYITRQDKRRVKSNLLWTVHLDLPNSARKFNNEKLESNTKYFYLPLPPILNSVLTNRFDKPYHEQGLNERIKFHGQNSGIALLSSGRISSALHTVLRRQIEDQTLADLICGYSPKHSSALYYCSHSASQIIDVYKKTVTFLSAQTDFSTDYLDVTLKNSAGSQSVLKESAAVDFMRALLEKIETSENPIQKHNAITCWLWYVILLLTSIRPVNHAPGILSQIDLDVNLLWVSDKEGRNTRSGRIIPICNFLNRAINGYLNYLNSLKINLCLVDPQLADIIYQVEQKKYPLLFFHADAGWEAIKPVHIIKQTEGLPAYPLNWPRHFSRSFLIGHQPDFLINAIFGHEEPDQEALHPFSSMPLQKLHQIASSYEMLANSLQLKLPKAWCDT